MSSYTCFDQLMRSHNVSSTTMEKLNKDIQQLIKNDMGIPIYFYDSELLKELSGDVYRINRKLRAIPAEGIDTCKADTTGVYLEEDIEQVGGICGRTFDLVHISGHISQWKIDPDSYQFGTEDYYGVPAKKAEVLEYEKKAMNYSLKNLENVLTNYNLKEKINITKLFHLLSVKDIEYVLQLVEGKTEVFFKGDWSINIPKCI